MVDHGQRKRNGKHSGWRCRKCQVESVTEWRRRLKRKAIEYLGGKCKYCGYDKYDGSLEFHHPNSDKDFGLGQGGHTRSWERVKKELDKCELVCVNCHREIHGDVAQE